MSFLIFWINIFACWEQNNQSAKYFISNKTKWKIILQDFLVQNPQPNQPLLFCWPWNSKKKYTTVYIFIKSLSKSCQSQFFFNWKITCLLISNEITLVTGSFKGLESPLLLYPKPRITTSQTLLFFKSCWLCVRIDKKKLCMCAFFFLVENDKLILASV